MFTPALESGLADPDEVGGLPWNQVAAIQPSSCHTDANDAQSPESRAIAQVSTSLRILNSAVSVSLSMCGLSA